MRDMAFNMIAMEINISNSYHVTKDTIIYSNNHKWAKMNTLNESEVVAFAADVLKEAISDDLSGVILYMLLKDKNDK